MSTIGSYEAKTHLPQLLGRVAKGERITITKHGVPIARLVPVKAGASQASILEAIEELRKFRQGRRLGRLTIRRMIDEGRRY